MWRGDISPKEESLKGGEQTFPEGKRLGEETIRAIEQYFKELWLKEGG